MSFENQKKSFLSKSDKSKKGSIDKGVKELVDKINNLNDYYTTSSCAGRIVLLVKKSLKKQEMEWLLVSHEKIGFEQIKEVLRKLPNYKVWFRFEPLILHVACKSIEDAQRLVNTARDVGFKRSGIQSTRKIVVEIVSTEIINTIIADKGKLLINDDYLKVLIKEMNKKLEMNKEKIERFNSLI